MNAPNELGHLDQLAKEVIHLAKFGAEGRTRDVTALARKMVSRYTQSFPELAEGLASITAMPSLVRSARRPMPVDPDSRLALARIIDTSLAEEPILPANLRDKVLQVVSEHQGAKQLSAAGLIPVKTALLVGPPGVGKTMTARWIASQLGRPLIVLDLASAISSYLGKSGQNVKQLFDYGKEFECVVLLDEVDAIAKRRSDETDLGELKRLVNVLLQELDDWPDGGLMLAATNHSSLLDPAIWRRFESVLDFPIPGADERRGLLRRELSNDVDVADAVVVLTEGMNFSEIRTHLQRAKKTAVLRSISETQAVLDEYSQFLKALPTKKRADISALLDRSGALSQRQIADLTGTSRTTMRKRQRPGAGDEN